MCGAYHSLALVRSLPPNSYNSQKPSEKRERGHSPHYLAAEREELFVGDSGLYCPLGVELREGMAAEVSYLAPSHQHLLLLHVSLDSLDFLQEMSKEKAPSWRKFGQQQSWLFI